MSSAADPSSTRSASADRILTTPVLAWASYDIGSAAFNAVITTFVFTVYLTSSSFGDPDANSSALGLGLGVAGLIIALLAPVTGQRADRSGKRTFWLGVNTALVVLCSAGLFFVRPDPAFLWLGIVLVALGNIFQEFAGVQYNALLPTISTRRTIGRVSGIGWGSGYLGGIILLGMIVVGFINPDVGWFGVTSEDGQNIRVAMLLAATWLLVFSIPVLIVLRDSKVDHGPAEERLGILDSYKALFRTITGLWRTDRHTLYFLMSSAIFRDGLAGVFTFGGVIAAGTFGFDPGLVIVFGIVANVVAGIATIAIGALDDRLGPKRVMVFCLVAMCVAGVGIFLLHNHGPMVFWVLGLTLCIFVGPVQSASRTFLARVIPPGREGEVFGLYATTGRAVSFLAPMMFAGAIEVGRRIVEPGQSAQHWGILGIVLVLLVGLAMLLPVHPRPSHLGTGDTGDGAPERV